MTVAFAGRAPATFEIKSAQLSLVALLLKSTDLKQLSDELAARFSDIPDFFDNDALVVDLAGLAPGSAGTAGDSAADSGEPTLFSLPTEPEVDFHALIALLRPYRLVPVAVRGGTPAQMQAALRSGLACAPDAVITPTRERTATTLPPAPAVIDAAPQGALVIDTPLRSGQQIYARGRDLVVLSMVNPGAEVIADGHIHVYAPLRGKAIAGARGNTDARIISLCLEAQLLSIAGVYRTSEVALPADVMAKPAQVRLVGGAEGKLHITPLNGATPRNSPKD